MKTAYLVSLIAVLALVLPLVAATNTLAVDVKGVEFNGVDITTLSNATVAGESGEIVPVSIFFTANENADDVQVSAWLQGNRADAAEKDFADLISGSAYHARLSLKLPTDIDPEEDLTLYVRIESDAGTWENSYTVGMQRMPYETDILFVDVDNSVEAGSNLPVDVVIKNLGRHELDDLIVSISIPELGLQKRAYFGDLTPLDNWANENDWEGDDDAEDTAAGTMSLKIPTDVKPGVYELVIEASNKDSGQIVKKQVMVVGVEEASSVLVPVTGKQAKTGETVTYDLVIVNSGKKLGVYEIVPGTVEGAVVTVSNPIVTVSGDSSEVVKVEVKASEEGTYSSIIDVNSDGKLVDKVVLSTVVEGTTFGGNVAILTIVLVIVFIVLLIVLVVLLTRKPAKEELEESYY